MKKISYTEIQTYLDCQKKHEWSYIKGASYTTPHFDFGSMAHKVLETRKIPNEALYPELKDYFGIASWENYFTQIFKELDIFLQDYNILHRELYVETEELKGVIDLVVEHKETKKITLLDYKFTSHYKDLIDIQTDQQLYVYVYLWQKYSGNKSLDVNIGYISIPKYELLPPRVLKSGALSKDKAQKTTYNLYLESIEKLGLNIEDYKDILDDIKNKTVLNTLTIGVNYDRFVNVIVNIMNVIKDMQKGYVLEVFDSYKCRNCPFVEVCKNVKI
ncbi:MAG: PD-(D/E)XK nuclease family protein [Desulfuromonadaceae bacterium]|nr:PD-(D/E)XK nuclease family protein [Desulfuromonadaceae bacterium]